MRVNLEDFRKYRDQIIDVQKRLVAIPALGPDNDGDGEYEKSRELITILREFGIDDIEEHNCPDDRVSKKFRPNIVARIKGKDSSKRLWILSHMDIVPAGELSLWESNPFELKVEEDRLVGRGVEDNHIGIIMSLFGYKWLKDNGITPATDINLVFVSDEETGSKYGLGYLVDNTDLFKPEDLYLVPDSGTPAGTDIEIAEKSIMWIKFMITGKQCHASRPELGINAMKAGAELIVSLNDLYDKFPKSDPMYSPPTSTFEPTKKEFNVPNVNTIPGEDIFYFDCRVLPHYDSDEVLAFINANVDKIVDKYGVNVKMSFPQQVIAPPPTSRDSGIVKKLEESIRSVLNSEPRLIGIGGGTVASFFRRKELPVAVWAKMDEVAHSPNEYIKFEDMYINSAITADLMMR